ncbi:MAG: hypothetical protein JNN06_12640 [Gemmobacter sp.]|uniref:hypothetical protein n=1 Tax=Gemmobacter sp. TaxID=1898957 RepID=UPI001A4054A5|nr:hypothetical protein [Gemmobacter sp.]MBL8563115.1 hypothetical protein [Gemmobacter sp.]
MPISLILLGFLVPLMSLALLRMARQRHGAALETGRVRRRARALPRARAEVAEAILRRRQHRRAVLHRVLHPPP